jgi:hypothetical protein
MSSDSPAASSPSSSGETSRRRLLTFLGVGGLGALAALFGRGEAQAGHDGTNVLHLGESNVAPAGAATHLETDVPGSGQTGLSVHNPHGQAITGFSASGIGVFGRCDTGQGGQFSSNSGRGVLGGSDSGPGVQGTSESGSGGEFFSQTGMAVVGRSQSSTGVHGQSETGVGGPSRRPPARACRSTVRRPSSRTESSTL